MSNSAKRLSQSHEVSAKVAEMLQTRARTALERYGKRVQRIQPSPEQKAMLARIRSVLDWAGHRPLRDRGAVVKRLATGN